MADDDLLIKTPEGGIDEPAMAQDADTRAAAKLARGNLGGRDPITVPSIKSDDDYQALMPGMKFKDPTGNVRTKPYKVTSDEEYEEIPEGVQFLDPEGKLRTKPNYQGIDFTSQTLYDMAVNDKERRKALERGYPGKVKERAGNLYIDDDGTLRRPKGFGDAPAAGLTAAAAPTIGSIGGEILGGVAGSVAGPPGTLGGAIAGGAVGGAVGQGFNDIVMGLSGVYDRSAGEEAGDLALSGVASGVGTAAGRGIAAVAPAIKGAVMQGAPKALAHFLGADEEALDTALGLRDKDVLVAPSTWAKESPHLANVAEVFDPAFRMQKPLLQSATAHYEKTAGELLENMGVKTEGKISDPATAPSTQKAGEAILAKRLEAQTAADKKLADVLSGKRLAAGYLPEGFTTDVKPWRAHFMEDGEGTSRKIEIKDAQGKVALTATLNKYGDDAYQLNHISNESKWKSEVGAMPRYTNLGKAAYLKAAEVAKSEGKKLFVNASGETSRFAKAIHESLVKEGYAKPTKEGGPIELFPAKGEILERSAAESRKAAQGLIDAGFEDIQKDVDAAMRTAKSGHNSGDLWTAVGDKLVKIRQGIAERAKLWYSQADQAAEGHLPDIGDLPKTAASFLEQLPEPFKAKYPDAVKKLADLAGTIDEKTGEVIKPPAQPTFGQLHELRSWFRSNVDYHDLTPGIRDGVYKFFATHVDNILHDVNAVPELKTAARLLDATDKWYREQIRPLQDARIEAVMKGLESGLPADPKVLFDTLVKEGRSDLTRKVAQLIGPNLWAGVKAADVQQMLEASKTLIPDQIDGNVFAREVLSRVKSGMLEAVHGREASAKLLQQAQHISALNGKLELPVRPGDKMADIIERARVAADAAKQAAQKDPLATLNKEIAKIRADHQRTLAQGRRTDPLGFIYDPTVGAAQAVDRILGSEDLILAAGARFGEQSPEFNMLRQVWAQRVLMGTLEPSTRLAKVSPEIQNIMFPGVSGEQMKLLAKEMDFLMASKNAHGTAQSMSAMAKVEHPWSSVLGKGGEFLPKIPIAEPLARAALGKYYAFVTKLVNSPTLMRFVQKGLKGDPQGREMAKQAVQNWMNVGGAVGAGVGESQYGAPSQ